MAWMSAPHHIPASLSKMTSPNLTSKVHLIPFVRIASEVHVLICPLGTSFIVALDLSLDHDTMEEWGVTKRYGWTLDMVCPGRWV